ncbi:unnamed protein product [Aphanomyces euteiches]
MNYNVGIFLLLCLATVTKASLVLTLCPASINISVPCLNDTVSGTTTNLQLRSSNQSYNFTHLNVTAIQDLPRDAQYVDLSFNQIRTISRSVPSSLTFLKLSHNALVSQWIQAPINVSILDVSYNQDGLPWMENISWALSLPRLTRLVFQGNQMTRLLLTKDNLPPEGHPFSALDISNNKAKLEFVIQTKREYDYLVKSVTLTLDWMSDAFVDAYQVCKTVVSKELPIQNVPVEYLPQGGAAKYDYGRANQFSVCVDPPTDAGTLFLASNFLSSLESLVQAVETTDGSSRALVIALTAVGSVLLVVFLVFRFGFKRHGGQVVKPRIESRQVLSSRESLYSSNPQNAVHDDVYNALPISTRANQEETFKTKEP